MVVNKIITNKPTANTIGKGNTINQLQKTMNTRIIDIELGYTRSADGIHITGYYIKAESNDSEDYMGHQTKIIIAERHYSVETETFYTVSKKLNRTIELLKKDALKHANGIQINYLVEGI